MTLYHIRQRLQHHVKKIMQYINFSDAQYYHRYPYMLTSTHTHICNAYSESCHMKEKVKTGNGYYRHIDFSILLTGTAIIRRQVHTSVLLHFILIQ